MPDKSIYEGNYTNDKQDGQGIFTFTNGIDQYIGSFKNNLFHGVGKLNYQHMNALYIGEFVDGLYDGKGIYKVENDYELNGIWSQGKMIGDGYATSYSIESFNCNLKKPIEDSEIISMKVSNKSTFAKKARLPDSNNDINYNNDENNLPITKKLVLQGKYTGPLYNGIPSGNI